jgi:hypothetical protein
MGPEELRIVGGTGIQCRYCGKQLVREKPWKQSWRVPGERRPEQCPVKKVITFVDSSGPLERASAWGHDPGNTVMTAEEIAEAKGAAEAAREAARLARGKASQPGRTFIHPTNDPRGDQ